MLLLAVSAALITSPVLKEQRISFPTNQVALPNLACTHDPLAPVVQQVQRLDVVLRCWRANGSSAFSLLRLPYGTVQSCSPNEVPNPVFVGLVFNLSTLNRNGQDGSDGTDFRHTSYGSPGCTSRPDGRQPRVLRVDSARGGRWIHRRNRWIPAAAGVVRAIVEIYQLTLKTIHATLIPKTKRGG